MNYVLITPARNEAALIGRVIESVAAQTVRPVRWIIVSDGSTDGTDDIVRRHAEQHPWIELLRMPEHRDRQFAAKANAFNAAYARVRADGTDYDVIGNLDADITVEPGYFEFLLGRFAANPRLGVAGTPFVDVGADAGDHTYAHRFAQCEHVSGACQLFRRACFEEVGGYVPVPGGAIDWIAVTTARMRGWETRTFTEQRTWHHRKLGTGNHHAWIVRFHYGRKAYYVGGHPVWAMLRGVHQLRQRPYVVGGLLFITGFLWSAVKRTPRAVTPELMAFHRQEQMQRLRGGWRLLGARPAKA